MLAYKSLRMLVEIIALIRLRSVLAGDETIQFDKSAKRIAKSHEECGTVWKGCDPNTGSAPYLGEVPNITVHFNENVATIRWDPINVTGVAGAANWTGYYVMWFKPKSIPVQSFDFKNSCMQLNKSQARCAIVTLDHAWTYPQDSLSVYVTTAPMPNYTDYTRYEYKPPHGETVSLPSPRLPRFPVEAIYGGCAASILLVLLVAGLLYYQKWKQPSKHATGFDHDVFISYSREDHNFLFNTVIPLLDEHGVKYCTDFKNWPPGIPWQENLVASIKRSHKIMFLASSSFVKKPNCKLEIDQALYWNGDSSNIIVLRIESFDIKQLPRTLRTRTFIDYSSDLEKRTWKKRLITALKDSSVDAFNTFTPQKTSDTLPNNSGTSICMEV